MASVLLPTDRETIERGLASCEEIYSTAVKIYYAAQGEWVDTEFTGIGILCHKDNVAFLRFVRFSDAEVFLEEELYKNFMYGTLSSQLHYFEAKDRIVGIAFADAADAELFHRHVTFADRGDFKRASAQTSSSVSSPPTQPTGASRRQPAPTPSNTTPIQPPSNTTSTQSSASTVPSQSSSSASFRSGMSTTFTAKKSEEKEIEISAPTDFKHIGHIGWTPDGGFQINNLPPELIEIFQKAGIKKRDLKNKETAQMVAQIVNEELSKTDADAPSSAASAGGPPPPPPPPPPPGMGSSGGPPPPPPPPPPPVSSGGPPPPPPPPGGSGSVRSTARPVEPPTNTRDNLLQSIREGKQLRQTVAPVSAESANRPKAQLNPTQAGNLASNLARAMEHRRTVLRENYSSGSEDEDDDDW